MIDPLARIPCHASGLVQIAKSYFQAVSPRNAQGLDATTDIHVYVIVRHKPTWSGLTGWEHEHSRSSGPPKARGWQ